jgi:formate dehydrogenase assembly factor FdhD
VTTSWLFTGQDDAPTVNIADAWHREEIRTQITSENGDGVGSGRFLLLVYRDKRSRRCAVRACCLNCRSANLFDMAKDIRCHNGGDS